MYHRLSNQTYGSWLRDPQPRSDADLDKVWTTQEGDAEAYVLYEFPNKVAYANNTGAKLIKLEHPFRVTHPLIVMVGKWQVVSLSVY